MGLLIRFDVVFTKFDDVLILPIVDVALRVGRVERAEEAKRIDHDLDAFDPSDG